MVDKTDIFHDLVGKAIKAGGDDAEVFFESLANHTYTRRMGNDEAFEQAETDQIGLRVMIGRRQALVSTGDFRPRSLAAMVEDAVVMAKNAPIDPYCALNDAPVVIGPDHIRKLDMVDPALPDDRQLREKATLLEDAALAVAGISNSEGAQIRAQRRRLHIITGKGLDISYPSTRTDIALCVIAEKSGDMEREYIFRGAVHSGDLGDLAALGHECALRALRRLQPRKIATADMTVVYHPRVANTVLRHIENAIKGDSIARGTSFLKDSLGRAVAHRSVTVIDDPLRPRGLRSRPCDDEGVVGQKRAIIQDGILQSWLLDGASARKLKETGTGHAKRSATQLPRPEASNLFMVPGPRKPAHIIADIADGLYVTELLGLSFNLVTGDYSRGASGFKIEKGQLTYPVSEVTIAGNLGTMIQDMEVADDLAFHDEINAPTIAIPAMTVSGR